MINNAWTSRHGLHGKQVALRNEANGNSESNVCASTPRFHYDFGTAPRNWKRHAQDNYATRSVDRGPFMSQVTAKWLHGRMRKNLETPACHAGPRSNICENQARAIPNHASKPLPSRLSQVPRRHRSPPCYCRDGGSSRWWWPCNAQQQRPHNAANACTLAATQRCTSVVKSLPTENAM